MPDQILEEIAAEIDTAEEKLAEGDAPAAQTSLDDIRAKLAELERMVTEHRGRLDGLDGRFGELEPLPQIAKDLRDLEAAEQSPERVHWRYRRIGG